MRIKVILLGIVLSLASLAHGAASVRTWVQSASSPLCFTASTANDTIVVGVSPIANYPTAVTDNASGGSNSYTELTDTRVSPTYGGVFWMSHATKSASCVTVTITGGINNAWVWVIAGDYSVEDQHGISQSTPGAGTTALLGVLLTPTVTDGVAIEIMTINSGGAAFNCSGSTGTWTCINADGWKSAAYSIVTSTSGIRPRWLTGGCVDIDCGNSISAVSFKAPGAPSTLRVTRRAINSD